MSQRKDVANNPEQAAQDIMVYLLTYRDDTEKRRLQKELDDIFSLAQKEYAGEAMSYFKQYFVYPVSRKRHNELAQAIASLRGCSEEQFARFVIIVDLLSKGGACKSTSLNTIILDKLLAATGKYYPINDDARLNAPHSLLGDARVNVREILKGLFITKAKECIDKQLEEKRKEQELKMKAAMESDGVRPGRIDEKMKGEFINILNDFLKGKVKKIEGKTEKPAVNKIDRTELAKKHAALTEVLGKKSGKSLGEAVVVTAVGENSHTHDYIPSSKLPASVSLPLKTKATPGKISGNSSLSASLNTLNVFFANRFHPVDKVDEMDSVSDEFDAIARRPRGVQR